MSSTQVKSLNVMLSVLLVLTFVSWRISAPGYANAGPDAAVTAGVLVAGFVKCRFIMSHFMEIRSSRRDLRLFADTWLIAFFGINALIYVWR
jgi:hypothetical protein